MRTAEERILLLRKRAWELDRKKKKKELIFSAVESAMLLGLLMALTVGLSNLPGRADAARYAGSSLLGESSGGYVLVAVVAFSVGVIITIIIRRNLRKKREKEEKKQEAE